MWYVSGNRDETMIEEPERFVGAPKARQHLAFGAASIAALAIDWPRCS